MWYNSSCRDEQNTRALCFRKPSNPINLFTGEAPSMCRTRVLAVHLDNDGARGGRFAMLYQIHRRLTRHKKDLILDRDAHMCVYCGGDATVVDHILPWTWDHNDDPLNLVASCIDCNLIASDKIFDSLFDKAAYIRGKRGLIKWTRRDFQKRSVNICINCKAYFKLCVNGATNFLCIRCAIEAGLDPVEQKRRKAEREEQKRQYLLQNPPIDY